MNKFCWISCTLVFSFLSFCSESHSDIDFEIADRAPQYSLSDGEIYDLDPSIEEIAEDFPHFIVIDRNELHRAINLKNEISLLENEQNINRLQKMLLLKQKTQVYRLKEKQKQEQKRLKLQQKNFNKQKLPKAQQRRQVAHR